MVQGSYPRYVDEEKQRLMKADEEAQFEVVEVDTPVTLSDDDNDNPEEPPKRCRWARWKKCCRKKNKDRKQRPLWRRVLRFFMTIFLLGFVWHAFVKPWAFGVAMFGCGRHNGFRGPIDIPVVKTGETPFSKPKMHYDFPDANDSFFVKQEQGTRFPTKTNVFGSVQFYASDNDKTSVDFHISVSDENLWDNINIDAKKDGVVFSADGFSIVEQHINVTAIVNLSKHEDMKKLYISTVNLDVKLQDDIENEFDVTRVSTVAGDIHVHGKHHSKCTKVKSVSGDVKGSFDLIHALGAKTVSGDIDLTVYPIKMDDKKAWLGTDSVSGNSKVHVIHPLYSRNLKSFHRTTSGDINVRYPEEWQGKMKLTTTSGDFKIIGKNMKVFEKKKGIAGKLWRALKGDGVSRAKLSTISGDIKVSVGDT